MRKFLVLVSLALAVANSLHASLLATSTLTGFNVIAGVYSFDIYARQTSMSPDSDIYVGTSQFFVRYNYSAVSSPTLSNINPRYTGPDASTPYRPMEITVVTEGGGVQKIVVTIRRGFGVPSVLSNAGPLGERICTVNLTITNASQTSQVSWDVVNSAITDAALVAPIVNTFVGSDNRPLPVQLASFTGSVINQQGHVRLNWRTLTETNNYGFYVQKSQSNQSNYQTISPLVPGHGTTLEPHDYAWTDVNATSGTWYYRLKQVDLDGTEHYSESIQPTGLTGVKEKPLPTEFALSQNYPNPFNPTTKLEYALPKQSHVTLEVYNLLGQRVARLLDEVKQAGYHAVDFDANGFSSGLYFYRMTANGSVTFMKKMLLLK